MKALAGELRTGSSLWNTSVAELAMQCLAIVVEGCVEIMWTLVWPRPVHQRLSAVKVRRFRGVDGAHSMVTTEHGAEGRDLLVEDVSDAIWRLTKIMTSKVYHRSEHHERLRRKSCISSLGAVQQSGLNKDGERD